MTTKRERAMTEYQGHKGAATVAHVERNIADAYPTAWDDFTGRQYGKLMTVANASYHAGRASTGAEIVDGDLVCIPGCDCLPLAMLRQVRAVKRVEVIREAPADITGLPACQWGAVKDYITDYYIGDTLVYTERA